GSGGGRRRAAPALDAERPRRRFVFRFSRPPTKDWCGVPANSAMPPAIWGWTMFTKSPVLNALTANHRHPPMIAAAAAAAPANGRNADNSPTAIAAMTTVAMRETDG